MTDNFDRLRALAGIKREEEEVIVLLPRLPVEQTRKLLDKLKEIAEEEDHNWTEIDIDGVKYQATGVQRDL